MKKILFLADINSAHTQKWVGGAASKGYDAAIFTLSEPVSDWHIKSRCVILNDYFNSGNKIYHKGDISKISYLKFIRPLRKIIQSWQPDIIHAHYATSYGMLGALSGHHPFILSVWGSDVFDFPNRSFIHRNFIKWIFNKADLLLSTSNIMKEEIGKYTSGKVEVTPFGINLNEFYRMEKEEGVNQITIGIIKSLEPHYGIDYLIRAFDIVLKKYSERNLKLLIVGDGSAGNEYKSIVNNLGITDRVEFTGKIGQDMVPLMHNRIDLFVCPSLAESFGVSVLEAEACEVPVIVTSVGGLKEVMSDNLTGKMIRPQNIEDIVSAISYFIDNPERIREYGKRGREFVKNNYDWNKNLIQISDIYARY